MFSPTVIELYRAPDWKSTPKRRLMGYSSNSLSLVMSCPKISTEPLSGFSAPIMSRRSVLFPWPDPPMITRVSPFLTSRSMPRRISRPE